MDPTFLYKATLFMAFIPLIAVHEFAHAWVADRLGDHTPGSQGRITLNPIAHIDPVGTLLLPAITIFFLSNYGFGLIGWGKPVMFNPRNFERPRLYSALTALAGPVINVAVALIVLTFAHGIPEDSKFLLLAGMFARISITLAVFNMMPMPPLDGGHIIWAIGRLSDEMFFRFSQFGWIILLVLINFRPFLLGLGYVIETVFNLTVICTGWPSHFFS